MQPSLQDQTTHAKDVEDTHHLLIKTSQAPPTKKSPLLQQQAKPTTTSTETTSESILQRRREHTLEGPRTSTSRDLPILFHHLVIPQVR